MSAGDVVIPNLVQPTDPSFTTVTLTGGEAAQLVEGVRYGALAQVSGGGAGFDIFTPQANVQYELRIAGKDVTNGNAPNNSYIDTVPICKNGPTVQIGTITSRTVVGAPGARTYSNNAGKLKVAHASGTTWYVDVAITRFP